jgi:hypothetical protein
MTWIHDRLELQWIEEEEDAEEEEALELEWVQN